MTRRTVAMSLYQLPVPGESSQRLSWDTSVTSSALRQCMASVVAGTLALLLHLIVFASLAWGVGNRFEKSVMPRETIAQALGSGGGDVGSADLHAPRGSYKGWSYNRYAHARYNSGDAVVTPAARKTIPINNPLWDVAGLGFINGIEFDTAWYMEHIRPRHAADAAYPQNPRNGRFIPAILSMSTPADQFAAELGTLFNSSIPPISIGNQAYGISLEFVLPPAIVIGRDISNIPTNIWTIGLTPVGSGIFFVVTAFPGLRD